jgi:MYXO-CTERM domain-containing protein
VVSRHLAGRGPLGLLVWAALPARLVAAAPEQTETRTPYPGITYERWEDDAVPVRIHVVEVDLSSAEIDLIATAEDQRGVTPSAFAAEVDAVVAINGDYFRPAGFAPAGLARGDSRTWDGSRDDAVSGFLRFHRDAVRTQVRLSPPAQVAEPPEETVGVIAGRPMLVSSGSAESNISCNDAIAMACEPAPRTAVALSEDRNTLWLVVVDGWQAGSGGYTAAELARFLATLLGAHEALLLDGGSASALWLDGALESSPSDGVERPVANHLAVRQGAQPEGLILGVVAEADVMNGPRIPGALVTIDDGRQKTFDGDNLWSFSVRPRWACVTAAADGYRPATQCRQVPSAGEIYASIALQPNSAFIDGGPYEDAGPRDGGPDGGDSPGADAGQDMGPGGCGCRTGSSGSGAPATLLLPLLALALRRPKPPGRRPSPSRKR